MCYIGPYSTYSTYSKEPGESGCSVACLVRYSTYSTCSKGPGGSAWCLPRLPGIEASRPRPDTPARRLIRIIRIIRSYVHTAAWHCATLPHLPGIEASPAAPPDRVFFLPLTRPSVNPGVGTGLPLQSWRGHRIARKTHHRAIAEGVSAMLRGRHR